jgi:tetratricopeptide (TPR) repeat protein
MSELRIETYKMPSAELGSENPLPAFDICLPHRLQDNYDRNKKERDFKVVVLENEILRATFLIELGGRLWSLIHKPTGKELLYVNPVFQPGNLAIRNAWFSGGVEWNIVTIGHTTHTCSPLFVASLKDNDGTPVLRMYEWDRVRLVPYQIDAFLPDGSEFLFVRMKIVNPNDQEIPMYWWSNIAVPELPKGRVLVPAEQAYRYGYEGKMTLVPIPYLEDIDQSYPTNFYRSADNFFCIEQGRQPWISSLDENGEGLVQTSTSRLKGRKLFVWGMGPGGRHWQEFLSVPNSQYIEIQAGLARTQSEYIQMPANTEWSWLEAYGLMQADPSIVHGNDWKSAYEHVDNKLKKRINLEYMENKLAETANIANKKPDEIIQNGSGWGTLELKRRIRSGEKPFCSNALIFADDSITEDQLTWLDLLEKGALSNKSPEEIPGAWMIQPEWQKILEDSVKTGKDSWLTWLHLGVMYYHNGDKDKALQAWEKSLSLEPSSWAYRNIAFLLRKNGKINESAELLLKASSMNPEIPSIALECCQALIDSGKPKEMLEFMDNLPESVRQVGRMRILEAVSAMQMEDLDRVEAILQSRPVVPDIREGEVSLSNLWFELHEKRISKVENIPINDELKKRVRKDFPPPSWLDFRQAY